MGSERVARKKSEMPPQYLETRVAIEKEEIKIETGIDRRGTKTRRKTRKKTRKKTRRKTKTKKKRKIGTKIRKKTRIKTKTKTRIAIEIEIVIVTGKAGHETAGAGEELGQKFFSGVEVVIAKGREEFMAQSVLTVISGHSKK